MNTPDIIPNETITTAKCILGLDLKGHGKGIKL